MYQLPRFNFPYLLVGMAVALGPLLAGCGEDFSELAPVEGRVTLDGQALPNASVNFQPDNGRASSGTTDAEGRYTLHYTPHQAGAEVDIHTVEITTQDGTVPARYHARSELRREVKPSKNQIDFDLNSKR